MFSIFFTDRDVATYEDAKTQDVAAFRAFFHAMLANGVYLPPSAYESWFVSTAIDDDALAVIADALPLAAQAAAEHAGTGQSAAGHQDSGGAQA
jgi:glutamate-1-semialdehyde 2,1-aminomutase